MSDIFDIDERPGIQGSSTPAMKFGPGYGKYAETTLLHVDANDSIAIFPPKPRHTH